MNMTQKFVRRPVPSSRAGAASGQKSISPLLQAKPAFTASLDRQNVANRKAEQPTASTQAALTQNLSSVGAQRIPEVLLALINDLTKFLAKEIEFLEERNFDAIHQNLQQKHRLMSNYQTNIAVIAAQPDIIQKAPEELRQKLKSAGKKMEEVAEQNAAALQGAMLASKRILQIVMETIREETLPKHTGYAHLKNARMKMAAAGAYSPVCPSVSISRTA